ncbi:MAG: hypothetical protein JSS31_10445 [Proteobacteria bacterium]|nr:hypothetical protein [Pseudomonadota bacterium]MBS0494352.1 hypothetical protein [Pseudomonadota bacterium]
MPHAPAPCAQGLPRRYWLGGMLAATALAAVPWRTGLSAAAATAPNAAFLRLSQLLTGYEALDADLAQRLQDALRATNPDLLDQSAGLLQFLDDRQVGLEALDGALKAQHPALAALPRQIMTAWYLGVVGGGVQARALALEHSLAAATVADMLKPPTYAYGAPGSWSARPAAQASQ